jgi:GH25 family lysozyme M1 (1,4-beta-N-acetylmuramidase)
LFRATSQLCRYAVRHWRPAVIAATVTALAGSIGILVTAGGPAIFSSGHSVISPVSNTGSAAKHEDRAVLVPAPGGSPAVTGPGVTTETWNWREHTSMGPTSVSGPVTHPGADHAGAGLERLGHHRAIVMTPAASSAPRGLDVSAYQTGISWSSVRSHGGQFAYIKATEGTGYVSPAFSSQYSGSFSAGLIRGSYHFALPDHTSGKAQADYFAAHGGGWSADGKTLPGALDIEYNPYGSTCYGLSQSSMRSWIGSFVGEYHTITSRWPVIYSTRDWWTTCTGNYSGFASHDPLWIACYCGSAGTLPAGWPAYTIWQNADSGTFPGDQDVFNGNANGLQRLAAGAGANPVAVAGAKGSVSVFTRASARSVVEKYLAAGGSWSAFANLGGTLPANVTALSSSSGTSYVFGVGLNGALYVNTVNGTSASGWKSLGGPSGGVQGVPSAVQDHGGIIRVYVRGGNRRLYEDRLSPSGSWSGFSNMGGTLPDNPTAFVGSGGYVWVFAVGTDRAIYERHLPSGGSWSAWRSLGGSLTGVPSVVQDHSGIARVYARGPNGNLYETHVLKNGGWSGLWNMGGTFPDDPRAFVGSGGYVWAFEIGTNHVVYERHLKPGSTWSGWNSMGGSVMGVPTAVQDGSGTFRVYARGTSGSLYEVHAPSGGSWSGWYNMGGVLF